MIKVVIDTNVFISSFFGGNPMEIVRLFAEGHNIIFSAKTPVFNIDCYRDCYANLYNNLMRGKLILSLRSFRL